MIRSNAYQGISNLHVMQLANNYNKAIFAWLRKDIPHEYRILDFGAGTGEFCNRFEGYNITAIEIDSNMHPYISCRCYEGLHRNIGKYDYIYSVNVLEHVQDDIALVDMLRNYLTEDGIIRIMVPARYEIYSIMDEYVGHYRRYRKDKLKDLFIGNGYKVIYCRYFDSIGYFVSMVYKLTSKNKGKLNPSSIRAYDKTIFPFSRLLDRLTKGSLIGKNLVIECTRF